METPNPEQNVQPSRNRQVAATTAGVATAVILGMIANVLVGKAVQQVTNTINPPKAPQPAE